MPFAPEHAPLKLVPAETAPSRLKYLKSMRDMNALQQGSPDWLELARGETKEKPKTLKSDSLV